MIIYASDLDRTLLYSGRFLDEHPSESKYSIVEMKDSRVISYMSDKVKDKLLEINSNNNVMFIPVTTRSIEEYKRIDLGFKPEFAILANGGIILDKNENQLEEWDKHTRDNVKMQEALEIIDDIEDMLTSVEYQVKVINSKYLFFKTINTDLFDLEVMYLMEKYKDWNFVRQRNKCYAIPKGTSKQSALEWLWNKLGKPYVVASGDSELDLSMLAFANKAIVPDHGTLAIEEATNSLKGVKIVKGGIDSPLETISIVNELSNKN
jgi:HAD superfamily hydrolase (TIGR01484 family)